MVKSRFSGRLGIGIVAVVVPMVLLGLILPETPVADAAQRGDIETVRDLLRQGADVNAAQGDGMTALHWAADRGDRELATVLIYAGANVDAGTRIGRYTPLHIATRKGSASVVRALLEAGGDVGAATTNSGATALHLAAATGDPAVIRELLDWDADANARTSAWGQTPLIFAAANGRTEAIRVLLAAGADPAMGAQAVDVVELDEADKAAERRLSELLDEFKEREGGGGDWQPTPSQVQAAIEAAREVQRRWPDVPKPGEDRGGGPPNAEAESTTEAEAEAPSQAEADTLGGEDSEIPDSTASGVEVAAENESPPPEADTIEAAEAAPDSAKKEEPSPLSYAQLVGGWGGLTPLHHAVRQGHADAVAALLEGGADIDQPTGGDSTTPLLMAAVNGQFDLALDLIERGANPGIASSAGTTPLFAVLERTWAPRASYAHPTEHQRQQATYLDVMDALLRAGADPNVRLESHLWYMEYTFGVLRGSGIDMQGATPFWRAAYALDVDAMRLLKEHGADPSIPTVKPPERRRRPPPSSPPADSVTADSLSADPPSTSTPHPDSSTADTTADTTALDADTTADITADSTEGGAPASSDAPADSANAEGEAYQNPTQANAEGENAEENRRREGAEEEDKSGVPPVPVGGPAIHPIHAASGVGYGQSFAGNAHRYVPNNWLAAVRFLVEECGAEVDVRDANAYTALHHAASRGDNELILYLVEQGADVTVLSRKGQTTADMANGPIQRVPPYPATVALLEKLGSKNNRNCVSC